MNKTTTGTAVFFVNDRQDVTHGRVARRESAIVAIDVPADIRRGVTRRVRTHARYVFPDWIP